MPDDANHLPEPGSGSFLTRILLVISSYGLCCIALLLLVSIAVILADRYLWGKS